MTGLLQPLLLALRTRNTNVSARSVAVLELCKRRGCTCANGQRAVHVVVAWAAEMRLERAEIKH
eukprot:7152627-Lingulodinium_polyedra.AAC.1